MIWVASRRLQVSRGSLRKRIVEYEDDYARLCNAYVLYGVKSENINLHIAILASPCYIDTIVESEMYWVSKRFWIIFAETSPVIFFFHLPQYSVSRQERLKLQVFVTPVWTLDCALKPSLITIIFILHVSSLFVYNVIQRSIILFQGKKATKKGFRNDCISKVLTRSFLKRAQKSEIIFDFFFF